MNGFDADNNGVATTTTDTNGEYSFIGILTGQCRIQVEWEERELFSSSNRGTDDGIDGDVDGSEYSSLFDVLATGIVDIDAGLYPVQGGGG